MQPHERRVEDEQLLLKEKIDKLEQFIHISPAFDGLPDWDKAMLAIQLEAMRTYNRVLVLRIAHFGA